MADFMYHLFTTGDNYHSYNLKFSITVQMIFRLYFFHLIEQIVCFVPSDYSDNFIEIYLCVESENFSDAKEAAKGK